MVRGMIAWDEVLAPPVTSRYVKEIERCRLRGDHAEAELGRSGAVGKAGGQPGALVRRGQLEIR
jgi:hypothetical protein